MTALRIRMIEDMQLRGFSERTQEAYVRAVRQIFNNIKIVHYRVCLITIYSFRIL